MSFSSKCGQTMPNVYILFKPQGLTIQWAILCYPQMIIIILSIKKDRTYPYDKPKRAQCSVKPQIVICQNPILYEHKTIQSYVK